MTSQYLLALSLLVSAGATCAADQAPERHTLPFNDCMRTDQIHDWHVVDDQTVTVRNGPNDLFLIKTDVACPRASLGGGIRFRTSQSNRAMGPGRICGDMNDQIVRRNDPPCQITSVSRIDKATYDGLSKKAKVNGSGAGPSGSVP